MSSRHPLVEEVPRGLAPPPAPAPEPVLELQDVTKRFADTVAVERVNATVSPGELLTVVGPSGCGKSTLLRLVAGLIPVDEGRVHIGGREVAGPGVDVPPERRNVGMVFQDHALFPHLTVAENVGFGLGRRDPCRNARVLDALELVGLAHLARRYPHELSGGEQQRVALARALAPDPAVVLLDEPFSNLDRNLRVRIREDTVAALRASGATGVFVTHDQEEALAVGDRVAVLRGGRVEQLADPGVVFHTPANPFVATFMGEADFVPGRRVGATAVTRFGQLRIAGSDGAAEVLVMIRPHEVSFGEDAAGEAVVRRVEFRGAFAAYDLDLGDGTRLRALRPHTHAVAVGTRVRVRLRPEHPVAAFPAGAV